MSSPLLLTPGAPRPGDADAGEGEAEAEPSETPERDLDPSTEPTDTSAPREPLDLPPTELARVLDPDARDADAGARGLLRLDIPSEWLQAGGSLEIDAPLRLICARCEGGGCAGCSNSGALRVDSEERRLDVVLSPGSDAAKRLRIEDPFGAGSTIRQVLVDLVPSEGAVSPMARWTPHIHAEIALSVETSARRRSGVDGQTLVLALVVLSAVGLALALLLR